MRALPIFLTFFLMGLADAMGPLSDSVMTQYHLNHVMATLLTFFVFIAFAIFSVPGGWLAARFGKKRLLLTGLGLNAVACLVPSVIEPSFTWLLACIFALGVGTTFLQVAGNPIMRDVSGAGAFSRNLAFAQGIKGLGSTASSYLLTALSAFAIMQGLGWRGAFPLFFALMALAFVGVLFTRIDETKTETPPSLRSTISLLSEPVFKRAVLGIFLYVGAEASMARFLFPSLKAMGLDEADASRMGPALFFLLLTVGRLLGGAALSLMSPRTCLRLSAGLGLTGTALLTLGSPSLAVVGVVVAGLGFANIWPMLFSLTVEEKPSAANELSGLMCMAISGGAIVPLVMGQLLDLGAGSAAFLVPAICFAYLLALSLKTTQVSRATTVSETV